MIGVGTPHGDDAAGLEVAGRLAGEPLPDDVQVLLRPHAGLELVDDLRDIDGAVIVDAVRTGGVPGSLLRVGVGSLARVARSSSHAFGVAEALRLADAIGLQPSLRLVGIEAATDFGARLSEPVRAALPAACRRVREELLALARHARG